MIRCNTEQEKQFVLGLFLELCEGNPRMAEKIVVKDIHGDKIRLPKKQSIPESQPPQIPEEQIPVSTGLLRVGQEEVVEQDETT